MTTTTGITVLDDIEIRLKAIELKGLKSSPNQLSSGIPQTTQFAHYPIDKATIQHLGSLGFVFSERESPSSNLSTMFFGTRCWKFDRSHPPAIELSAEVHLSMSIRRRGVVMIAKTRSSSHISPLGDNDVHFHLFRALVEMDPSKVSKLPVASKLAQSEEGFIVVSFEELGLAGLREISSLFTDFHGGNGSVHQLGRTQAVFTPLPCETHFGARARYVPEADHARLLARWKTQLENYRESLRI